MPPALPILVLGRDAPINVPCELPDSFTFSAFLPARGVRRLTAWLTSCDVKDAEIKDVVLAEPEPNQFNDEWAWSEDEQRRADEVAGDVLREVLKALGLSPTTRTPLHVVKGELVRPAIALAHEAECKAWEALRAAHLAVNPEGWFYVPNPATERKADEWASKAANYLQRYVDRCLEDACRVQGVKAERQQAEHPRRDEDDDEDGSERIRAPRSLDAPTLKALSWDVNY